MKQRFVVLAGVATLASACVPVAAAPTPATLPPPTLAPVTAPPTAPPTTAVPVAPAIVGLGVTAASGVAPFTTSLAWSLTGSAPFTCTIDTTGDATPDYTVPSCAATGNTAITFSGAGEHTATLTVTNSVGTVSKSVATSAAATSAEAFDIEFVWLGSVDARYQSAFSAAAKRWTNVITAGFGVRTTDIGAGNCVGSGNPKPLTTVEDLKIEVQLVAIDGPGKVLGSAGPCVLDLTTFRPIYGGMKLDLADLDTMSDARLLNTITHEIGHILGIGTMWGNGAQDKGLLDDSVALDPRFTGAQASARWQTLSGGGNGLNVPVEATGGSGTALSHWREKTFTTELMTGWINDGVNALSALTVAALADLYYAVDVTKAEAYSLPGGWALAYGNIGPGSGHTEHLHTTPIMPVFEG